MDAYGAVFVRIQKDGIDKLLHFLQAHSKKYIWHEFKTIVYPPDRSYALVARYGRSDNVPDWLPIREKPGDPLILPNTVFGEFSDVFEDVIAFYNVDDYIDYQHWQKGKLVRLLDGACEGWDTVLGTPEPWEEDCFFSLEKYERRIADLKDFNELTEEKEQKIKKAWQEKIILSDAEEPPVSPDEMIRAIHKFYGVWPAYAPDICENSLRITVSTGERS